MAAKNISTPSGRIRLGPRSEPYYTKIAKGRHIGFRKNAAAGTWIARYTEGKEKQYRRLGAESDFKDYDAVLDAAQAWFAIAAEDPRASAPYTVAQCVDDYIADMRIRVNDNAAKRNEQSANKHIVPKLGKIEVDRLRTRRIKLWRDGLVLDSEIPDKVRASKDTANRVLTILKAALNRAFRDGTVRSDAEWRRLKPFEKVGRSRDVFLTLTQCRVLVKACDEDFALLVQSALLTGARYSELTERTVADFDARNGVLRIGNGKTGPRDLILNDAGIQHFKRLAKSKLPTAPLHLRSGGERWTRALQSRRLRDAVKVANEKIKKAPDRLPTATVFYSLRHTHASLALLGAINIQVLAENMGTSVRMIEKHYGKFLRADRRAMFNSVSFQ